jgi:hypothetical protein
MPLKKVFFQFLESPLNFRRKGGEGGLVFLAYVEEKIIQSFFIYKGQEVLETKSLLGYREKYIREGK